MGNIVGLCVGRSVGLTDGGYVEIDGCRVVGAKVGSAEGIAVGDSVVGTLDGDADGE